MSVTPGQNFSHREPNLLVFLIANEDAFHSSIAHSLHLIKESFRILVVFTQLSPSQSASREWPSSENVSFLRCSTFITVQNGARIHLWWRELQLLASIKNATRGQKIAGVVTDNLHTCSSLATIQYLGIRYRDVVLILSVFRDFIDLMSLAANNRHVTGRSQGENVDKKAFWSAARQFGASAVIQANRVSQSMVLRLMRAPKRLGLMFWEFEDYLRLTSDFCETKIIASCPTYRLLPPLLLERAQPCQFLETHVSPRSSVNVFLLTMEGDLAFLEAVRQYITKKRLAQIIVRPHPRRRRRDTQSIVAYLSKQQSDLEVQVRVDETASIAELAAQSKVLLAEYSSAAIWEALESNPNLTVRGVWSDLYSRNSDSKSVKLQDIFSAGDNKVIRAVGDCMTAKRVIQPLDVILVDIFADSAHS